MFMKDSAYAMLLWWHMPSCWDSMCHSAVMSYVILLWWHMPSFCDSLCHPVVTSGKSKHCIETVCIWSDLDGHFRKTSDLMIKCTPFKWPLFINSDPVLMVIYYQLLNILSAMYLFGVASLRSTTNRKLKELLNRFSYISPPASLFFFFFTLGNHITAPFSVLRH